MERKQQTVLWIVPVVKELPELGWIKELSQLSSLDIDLKTLMGEEVTLSVVAKALREPYDLVLLSGHGGPSGMILPGGKLIRPLWLAGHLSEMTRPQLTIIAACSSSGIDGGTDLSSMTSVLSVYELNSIGFPAEADDEWTALFSLETVRAFSLGKSPFESFKVGHEAIQGTSLEGRLVFSPGTNQTPLYIDERLLALEQSVRGLVTYLKTMVEWNRLAQPLDPRRQSATDAIRGIAPQAAGADDAEGAASPQVDGE